MYLANFTKQMLSILLMSLLLSGCLSESLFFGQESPISEDAEAGEALDEGESDILTDEADSYIEEYEEIDLPFHDDLLGTLIELEEESNVPLLEIDPFGIAGNIVMDGSFASALLAEAMNRRFVLEGYRGWVHVNSLGTEESFQLLCQEEGIDIVQADRAITLEELQSCAEQGRLPISFPVIHDAIAVVVHPENEFVDTISLEELALILTSEQWSDVNPEWPDRAIKLFLPDTQSGTVTTVARTVLNSSNSAIRNRANATFDDDIGALNRHVSREPYSIGFFSYAHYYANSSTVKLLTVANSLPLADGTYTPDYPLKNRLFLHADLKNLHQQEQVMTFINFFLTHVMEEGMWNGYLPVEVEHWDKSKSKFFESIRGDMVAEGSIRIQPILQQAFARFKKDGYQTHLELRTGSATAGVESLCESGSDVDMAMASRLIRDEEKEECQEIGREPLGIQIGLDTLAIVTNKANTNMESVTTEELRALFMAEKWSDVNPEWPDEPILRFIPSEETGAFGFFVESVLYRDRESLITAPNTTMDADGNILTEAIRRNTNAIGFLAYAQYERHLDQLKLVAINQIRPDQGSTQSGNYLLTRPLMIYTDPMTLREKPQVATFITFLLKNINLELQQLGYVPLNDRAKEDVWTTFLKQLQSE